MQNISPEVQCLFVDVLPWVSLDSSWTQSIACENDDSNLFFGEWRGDLLHLPSQNYLLLFKDVYVFEQAKLAEQLGKVIRHLRGGASLAAGRCPSWWAHTVKIAAAAAWEVLSCKSGGLEEQGWKVGAVFAQ